MPWMTVEKLDDDGELRTHVVPVRIVGGFATEREATAFALKCDRAGNAVLTDSDDLVTATYFGHTLSPVCICDPRRDTVDAGLYIHREAN